MKNSIESFDTGKIMSRLFLFLVCVIVCASPVFADMGFTAYTFSHLLNEADCVVAGTVVSVEIETGNRLMAFNVEEQLLGSTQGTVTIGSTLYNGAYIEDEAYLDKGYRCIVFLRENGGMKTIVNGVAGVMRIECLDDVRRVVSAFSSDNDLFSKKNMKTLETLFFSLRERDTKRRFLESLKGMYTESDERFLNRLLESGGTYEQKYAAIQAGYADITTLRPLIESICSSAMDASVRADCLYALAQFADPESLPLVLSCLDDNEQAVRTSAVFASGVIGESGIAEPLLDLYKLERDVIDRLEIITALERIRDKTVARKYLDLARQAESHNMIVSRIDAAIHKME